MASNFKVIDKGWKRAMAAFAALDGAEVKAGILDNATAVYGVIHEADTGWLRDTTDRKGRKLGRIAIEMQNDLVGGIRGTEKLKGMAKELVEGFREALNKAGLVATGALVDSIEFSVED